MRDHLQYERTTIPCNINHILNWYFCIFTIIDRILNPTLARPNLLLIQIIALIYGTGAKKYWKKHRTDIVFCIHRSQWRGQAGGWWVVWPGPGAPSYWGCYAATSTASNTPSLASLRQATHCLQPRQPHYWHHTYTGSRGRPGCSSRSHLASAQEPGTCPAGSRGCSQWWSSTRRFRSFHNHREGF